MQASEKEVIWVLRFAIVIVGILGSVIAITVNSVFGLYILSGDLMYVILFPQLTCAMWIQFANTYGSLIGFMVSFAMRILAGEPLLGLTAAIQYPSYDNSVGQRFPHKTFVVIIHYICIIGISFITDRLFKKSILPKRFDVFNCIRFENDKKLEEPYSNNMDIQENKTE